MIRITAILTCLTLVGCSSAPAQQNRTVDPGANVTLAPGETAEVTGTGLKVRFVAVLDDTRCPSDTTCIWAGEVKARFEIIQSVTRIWLVELRENENTVSGETRVTLVRVEPLPASNTRIAPQDYRATLKMDTASQSLNSSPPPHRFNDSM